MDGLGGRSVEFVSVLGVWISTVWNELLQAGGVHGWEGVPWRLGLELVGIILMNE